MAQSVAFYLLLHQPWRFRIPLGERPPSLQTGSEWQRYLFDHEMNARYFHGVAERSYIPMLTLLEELLHTGFQVNLGLSWNFFEQASEFGEPLAGLLSRVLAHPGVEIIGVEPYHSFIPLVDAARFRRQMRAMRQGWMKRFGKMVRVTDTTEMLYSDQIYWALALEGFEAMLMDGRPDIVGAEGPSGVYQGPGPMALVPRHWRLSDDVGYRFSNQNWDGYPLMAPRYADWIKDTPASMILVGWDFETFGEHHRQHTGIFDFIGQLALELKRRKIQTVKLSDALSLAHAGRLQPPMRPVTWAGTGDLSFFLGNVRQWDLYTRMQSAYHKAIMTQRPTLIDVAMKLMQSDHLHMLHWYDTEGPEADVSSYFTPGEWWAQGKEAILEGLGRVFEEFEMALDDAVRDKVPTNYR